MINPALQSLARRDFRRLGSLRNCLPLALALLAVAARGQPAQAPGKVLELSMKQAIEIALAPDGNAAVRLAQEMMRVAEAQSGIARSALLPNIDSYVGQRNTTNNLQAFGIILNIPIPGFKQPELVGPYNTFDARGSAALNIFHFSSIRRYQASQAGVGEARAESESAKDRVAGQVSKAYVAVRRADARLEAARANVGLSEDLLRLAENQKTAGTGTAIEVTRARVQLANQRQLLVAAAAEQRQAQLQLLRVLDLDMDVTLRLTDQLEYQPAPAPEAEQAIHTGLESRADYLAQQRRERRLELSYGAAKWERLPSLRVYADYGVLGTSINNAVPTRRYGWQVDLPIFDGGRMDAERAEARAQLEQERIRTQDLRDQIELEIRVALDAMGSAQEQVQAAQEGLRLAEQELAQAERRYKAGVATSIEVTDAQTRLERARENQIGALFAFNIARVDLGEAQGTIRSMIP